MYCFSAMTLICVLLVNIRFIFCIIWLQYVLFHWICWAVTSSQLEHYMRPLYDCQSVISLSVCNFLGKATHLANQCTSMHSLHPFVHVIHSQGCHNGRSHAPTPCLLLPVESDLCSSWMSQAYWQLVISGQRYGSSDHLQESTKIHQWLSEMLKSQTIPAAKLWKNCTESFSKYGALARARDIELVLTLAGKH